MTVIDHPGTEGIPLLALEYQYLDNNLVSQIKERDVTQEVVATTDFGYDARGRLTSEKRSPNGPTGPSYDLEYEYDQGGNRTKKIKRINEITDQEVRYTYDIQDPVLYGTDNNRLVKSETWQVSEPWMPMGAMMQRPLAPRGRGPGGGPGGGPVETVLSRTWYYYTPDGNVNRAVTNQPLVDPDLYKSTLFWYAGNGNTVTFVVGEQWNWPGQGGIDEYQITWAREFQYDGARARYLNRELDPAAVQGGSLVPVSEVWSDYDGDEIYGDFTVEQEEPDPPEPRQQRSFVMGMATVGWKDGLYGERVPDGWSLRYYHKDMIGTARFMTDYIGDPGEEAVFTAFGQRVDGSPRRFGYAGAWGYQSTLDDQTPPAEVFPFLHVGARYYDPATGRFLQRDPIGVAGGLNVYEYVHSNPQGSIDPEGLDPGVAGPWPPDWPGDYVPPYEPPLRNRRRTNWIA